ncbi:hypothetical protein [Silvimonas iriomotensis]|nr:hypothetical protein [Silvimonas iriomotensis]
MNPSLKTVSVTEVENAIANALSDLLNGHVIVAVHNMQFKREGLFDSASHADFTVSASFKRWPDADTPEIPI